MSKKYIVVEHTEIEGGFDEYLEKFESEDIWETVAFWKRNPYCDYIEVVVDGKTVQKFTDMETLCPSPRPHP